MVWDQHPEQDGKAERIEVTPLAGGHDRDVGPDREGGPDADGEDRPTRRRRFRPLRRDADRVTGHGGGHVETLARHRSATVAITHRVRPRPACLLPGPRSWLRTRLSTTSTPSTTPDGRRTVRAFRRRPADDSSKRSRSVTVAGGMGNRLRHRRVPARFYVPVVLAAVRLGPTWTLAVSIAAGPLASPLVPLPDVGIGLAGHGRWLVRTGFFAAIGVLVAVLTDSIRRYEQQQVDVATHARQVAARERDLAVQRASVIQTLSHELAPTSAPVSRPPPTATRRSRPWPTTS